VCELLIIENKFSGGRCLRYIWQTSNINVPEQRYFKGLTHLLYCIDIFPVKENTNQMLKFLPIPKIIAGNVNKKGQ
jgi:hypothetical protein